MCTITGMTRKILDEVYDEQWFLDRCVVDGECWLWKGAKHASGYGRIKRKRVPEQFVHRWAYICLVGLIPEGYQIDHLCKRPSCVRHSHLEAVSQRENWERSNSPSRLNALKTHCKHGHPLTPDMVYITKSGGRTCKVCQCRK